MTVGGIWRGNAVSLLVLIFLNLAVMSFGQTAWIALGILCLIGAIWLRFKTGLADGHQACAVRNTVETVAAEGGFGDGRQDRKYVAQAWSVSTGIRGMLLSALIPYVFSCLHIICVLLQADAMILPSRVAAWILSMTWWCIILHWQPVFDHLTPMSVAVMMITPFLLPACHLAGYLQGPKLWAHTETAMAQGRRRAKARSRVIKKKKPRAAKPEV